VAAEEWEYEYDYDQPEDSGEDTSYEYEEPSYEEPSYEEPVYQEPSYQEPSYEEGGDWYDAYARGYSGGGLGYVAPEAEPESWYDAYAQAFSPRVEQRPTDPYAWSYNEGGRPETIDTWADGRPMDEKAAKQARIYRVALENGLDEEGARVLVAVTETEAGLFGALGDGGQSRGPFQFYEGGQMPAFRQWVQANGIPGDPNQLVHDPEIATSFAASNYLGAAIKRGQAQGLHGADLATYAQRTGQVSVSPERTGENYQRLFATGDPYGDAIRVAQPSAGARARANAQIPPGHWDGDGHDHGVATPYTQQQVGRDGSVWQIAFDFDQPYADPFNPQIPNHRGVDLQLAGAPNGGENTPYTAMRNGRVVKITNDPHGGIGIIVDTGDPSARYDRYFHNNAVSVREGDVVQAGRTNLGVIGQTGSQGFPHLHYEVSQNVDGDPMGQTIDPRPYLGPPPGRPQAAVRAQPGAPWDPYAPYGGAQQQQPRAAAAVAAQPNVVELTTPYTSGRRQTTDGIVIHATRGQGETPQAEYEWTLGWFGKNPYQVSANAVIGPDGQIAMPRDWDLITHHAGENNATKFGIELAQSAADSARGVPYTDAQYASLGWLLGQLHQRYGIPIDRSHVVGHEELDQGRRQNKTDPGENFDWGRALQLGAQPQRGVPAQQATQTARVAPAAPYQDVGGTAPGRPPAGTPTPATGGSYTVGGRPATREQYDAAVASDRESRDRFLAQLPEPTRNAYTEWEAFRRSRGEDPNDIPAFRAHIDRLGVENPWTGQEQRREQARVAREQFEASLPETTRTQFREWAADREARGQDLTLPAFREHLGALGAPDPWTAQEQAARAAAARPAAATPPPPAGRTVYRLAGGTEISEAQAQEIGRQNAAAERINAGYNERIAAARVERERLRTWQAQSDAYFNDPNGQLPHPGPRPSTENLDWLEADAARGADTGAREQPITVVSSYNEPASADEVAAARARAEARVQTGALTREAAASSDPLVQAAQAAQARSTQLLQQVENQRILDRESPLDPRYIALVRSQELQRQGAMQEGPLPQLTDQEIAMPTIRPAQPERFNQAIYDYYRNRGYSEEQARAEATLAPAREATMEPPSPRVIQADPVPEVDPNISTYEALANAAIRGTAGLATGLYNIPEAVGYYTGQTWLEEESRERIRGIQGAVRESGALRQSGNQWYQSPLGFFEGAAENLPNVAATVGAAFLTGGGSIAAMAAGGGARVVAPLLVRGGMAASRAALVAGSLASGGQMRESLRDEVAAGLINQETADFAGAVAAATEALTETVMPGLDRMVLRGFGLQAAKEIGHELIKRGLGGALKTVGGEIVNEAGEELVTEAVGIGTDLAFSAQKPTMLEAAERLATAGVMGGALGGAMAGPITASGAVVQALEGRRETANARQLDAAFGSPADQLARDGVQVVVASPDFGTYAVRHIDPTNPNRQRAFTLNISEDAEGNAVVTPGGAYRGEPLRTIDLQDPTADRMRAARNAGAALTYLNQQGVISNETASGAIESLQKRAEAAASGAAVATQARPSREASLEEGPERSEGYIKPDGWSDVGTIPGTDLHLRAADHLPQPLVSQIMRAEADRVIAASVSELTDRMDKRSQDLGITPRTIVRRLMGTSLYGAGMIAQNDNIFVEGTRNRETGIGTLGGFQFDTGAIIFDAINDAKEAGYSLAQFLDPRVGGRFLAAKIAEVAVHEPSHDVNAYHGERFHQTMTAYRQALVAEQRALEPIMRELVSSGAVERSLALHAQMYRDHARHWYWRGRGRDVAAELAARDARRGTPLGGAIDVRRPDSQGGRGARPAAARPVPADGRGVGAITLRGPGLRPAAQAGEPATGVPELGPPSPLVSREAAMASGVPVEMPSDPRVQQALARTPGIQVTPDGLVVDATRFQRRGSGGAPSLSGNVYYGVSGPETTIGGDNSYYDQRDRLVYGGSEAVRGPTVLRRPFVGTSGAFHPEGAQTIAEAVGDQDAARPLAVLNQAGFLNTASPEARAAITDAMEQYGVDRAIPERIFQALDSGLIREQAARSNLSEAVAGEALRRAGYDGYIRLNPDNTVDSIMDVREQTYPDEEGRTALHPQFEGAAPAVTRSADGYEQIGMFDSDEVRPSNMAAREAALSRPIPTRVQYPPEVAQQLQAAGLELQPERGLVVPMAAPAAGGVEADRRPDGGISFTELTPGPGGREVALANPIIHQGGTMATDRAQALADLLGEDPGTGSRLVEAIQDAIAQDGPTTENVRTIMASIGLGDPDQAALLVKAARGDTGQGSGSLANHIVSQMLAHEGRIHGHDGLVTLGPDGAPSIASFQRPQDTADTGYVVDDGQLLYRGEAETPPSYQVQDGQLVHQGTGYEVQDGRPVYQGPSAMVPSIRPMRDAVEAEIAKMEGHRTESLARAEQSGDSWGYDANNARLLEQQIARRRAVLDRVESRAPLDFPGVEPRIIVPAEAGEGVTTSSDWNGGVRAWAQINGATVRGVPIDVDDERVPDVLYHATTNLPAVQRSGMLRAGGVGGLGGDNRDNIVSLTISRPIADGIARDLRTAIDVARIPEPATVQVPWEDSRGRTHYSTEWADPEEYQRYREAVITRLQAQARTEGWTWDAEHISPTAAGRDIFSTYFQVRSYQTDLKNPLIYTELDALRLIDPENIGVVEVPRDALRTGALLTDLDLGRNHLEEIRSYGDVPLQPGVPTSGPSAMQGELPPPPPIVRPDQRSSQPFPSNVIIPRQFIAPDLRAGPETELAEPPPFAGPPLVGTEEAIDAGWAGIPDPRTPIENRADLHNRLVLTRFLSQRELKEILGERPQDLQQVIDFMVAQRQKVVEGRLLPSDVAKAYLMTVSSQGQGAIDPQIILDKTGLAIPDHFLTPNRDGVRQIRAEDAAAAWIASPTGQRTLAQLDQGTFDEAGWENAASIRAAFSDDRLNNNNVMGTRPNRRGRISMRDVVALTADLNQIGDNPRAMAAAVERLNGIGPRKTGFIQHLLGFGEMPTLDARALNTWITGQGDIRGMDTEAAQIARLMNQHYAADATGILTLARIISGYNQLRRSGFAPDIPKAVYNAVLHNWLWTRIKGHERTYAPMYEAQAAPVEPIPQTEWSRDDFETRNQMMESWMRDPYEAEDRELGPYDPDAREGPSAMAAEIPSIPAYLREHAVPFAGYEPNTIEGRMEQVLMDAARAQGTNRPQFEKGELGKLEPKFLPSPTATKVEIKKNPDGTNKKDKKGKDVWVESNYGVTPALEDQRVALQLGRPASRWYTELAHWVYERVGPEAFDEFRVIFGVTSAQTEPTENMATTFAAMKIAREMAAEGILDDAHRDEFHARMKAYRIPSVSEGVANVEKDGTPKMVGFRTYTEGKGKQIMDLYTTGSVTVQTNAKTPSYAGNMISALMGVYDPNVTVDVWMARAMNYWSTSWMATSDQAYRASHAIYNWLAREEGISPHEAQAAIWFPIKTAWERGGTAIRQKIQDGDLADALRDAEQAGLLRPELIRGDLAAINADARVQHAWEQLAPVIASSPLSPGQAEAGVTDIVYPGQTRGRGETKEPARPVDRAQRAALLDVAEGQAPTVGIVGVPDRAALGYANGQLDWLGQPHQVVPIGDGLMVRLVGGNLDTARYVAAELGERAGAPAVSLQLASTEGNALGYVFSSSGEEPIEKADLEAISALVAGTGIPLVADPGGHYVALIDSPSVPEEIYNSTVDAIANLGIAGLEQEGYRGWAEHLPAAEYRGTIQALGHRFGAGEPQDLPVGAAGGDRAAEEGGAQAQGVGPSAMGAEAPWAEGWSQPTPEEFLRIRSQSDRGAYLSASDVDSLRGKRLFVKPTDTGGYAGFALDEDNDLQNVFNVPGPDGRKSKGAGVDAMLMGISQGADKLDAFDPFLPKYYHQFGFRETGRVPFNDEYAPEGWDYANGRPDVVLMTWDGFHNGESPDDVRARVGGPKTEWIAQPHARTFDDWDQAAEVRDGRLADLRGGAVPGRVRPVAGPGRGGPAVRPDTGPGAAGRGDLAGPSAMVGREAAITTGVPLDLPTRRGFLQAVENTDGAQITPDGLSVDLIRWQQPEQVGAEAGQSAVFYLASGTHARDVDTYRGTFLGDYGGDQRIAGPSVFRRPFVARAGVGDAAIAAYAALNGQEATDAMRGPVGRLGGFPRLSRDEVVARTRDILTRHDAGPEAAEQIVDAYRLGAPLENAVEERIVSHDLRRRGYDSVIGYSGVGRNARLTELMDVRERTYPDETGQTELHPQFGPGPSAMAAEIPGWVPVSGMPDDLHQRVLSGSPRLQAVAAESTATLQEALMEALDSDPLMTDADRQVLHGHASFYTSAIVGLATEDPARLEAVGLDYASAELERDRAIGHLERIGRLDALYNAEAAWASLSPRDDPSQGRPSAMAGEVPVTLAEPFYSRLTQVAGALPEMIEGNPGRLVRDKARPERVVRRAAQNPNREEPPPERGWIMAEDGSWIEPAREGSERMVEVTTGAQETMRRLREAGAKPDELAWTGVETWLRDQGDGPIDRAALMDHLSQRRIVVEEMVLGGREIGQIHVYQDGPEEIVEQEPYEVEEGYEDDEGNYVEPEYLYDDESEPEYRYTFRAAPEENELGDELVYEATGNDDQGYWVTTVDGEPIGNDPVDDLERVERAIGDHARLRLEEPLPEGVAGPVQFEWEPGDPSAPLVQPGGEEYREVLLILPWRGREELALFEQAADRASDAYHAFTADHSYEERVDDLDLRRQSLELLDAANRARAELDAKRVEVERQRYTGSHFTQPGSYNPVENVAVHVRMTTRIGPNGERRVFIEEIQSDWQQQGREKGFMPKSGLPKGYAVEFRPPSRIDPTQATRIGGRFDNASGRYVDETVLEPGTPEHARQMRSYSKWYAVTPDEAARDDAAFDSEAEARTYLERQIAKDNPPPEFPFMRTESWATLAFRRMIRWAAEHGYDQIAWTTGAQQNDRYGPRRIKNPEALPKFYDGVLVTVATDLGKPWGVAPTRSQISVHETGQFGQVVEQPDGWRYTLPNGTSLGGYPTQEAAQAAADAEAERAGTAEAVHVLDIPPQMKRSALEEGQPLFMAGEMPTGQPPGDPEAQWDRQDPQDATDPALAEAIDLDGAVQEIDDPDALPRTDGPEQVQMILPGFDTVPISDEEYDRIVAALDANEAVSGAPPVGGAAPQISAPPTSPPPGPPAPPISFPEDEPVPGVPNLGPPTGNEPNLDQFPSWAQALLEMGSLVEMGDPNVGMLGERARLIREVQARPNAEAMSAAQIEAAADRILAQRREFRAANETEWADAIMMIAAGPNAEGLSRREQQILAGAIMRQYKLFQRAADRAQGQRATPWSVAQMLDEARKFSAIRGLAITPRDQWAMLDEVWRSAPVTQGASGTLEEFLEVRQAAQDAGDTDAVARLEEEGIARASGMVARTRPTPIAGRRRATAEGELVRYGRTMADQVRGETTPSEAAAAAAAPDLSIHPWEILSNVRYNNMLLGPRGILNDYAWNTGMLFGKMMADPFLPETGGLDPRARWAITKVEAAAMARYLPLAIRRMGRILFTGVDTLESEATGAPRNISGRLTRRIENAREEGAGERSPKLLKLKASKVGAVLFAELAGRLKGMADVGIKQIAWGMEMNRQAAILAWREGVHEVDSDEWHERIAEIMAGNIAGPNATPEERRAATATHLQMQKNARREAERTTFQGDMGTFGRKLEPIQRHPVGQFVLPFLKTLYHIRGWAIDFSPLGLAGTVYDVARSAAYKKVMQSDRGQRMLGTPNIPLPFGQAIPTRNAFGILGGPYQDAWRGTQVGPGVADLDRRLMANMIGTTGFFYLLGLAFEGALSASGPPDDPIVWFDEELPSGDARSLKRTMQATGWRPYSVKIPWRGQDYWVNYSNWGPLGYMMGAAAAIGESYLYGVSAEKKRPLTGSPFPDSWQGIQDLWNGGDGDTLRTARRRFFGMISDVTFLSGMSDLVKLTDAAWDWVVPEGPETPSMALRRQHGAQNEIGAWLGWNALGSFMPAAGLTRTIAQSQDPYARSTEFGGIREGLAYGVPDLGPAPGLRLPFGLPDLLATQQGSPTGRRSGLAITRDALGRPVESEYSGAYAWLPFRATQEHLDDAVLNTLLDAKVGAPSPPSELLYKVERPGQWTLVAMPQALRQEFARRVGEAANARVQAEMQAVPEAQRKADPDAWSDRLKAAMSETFKTVRNEMQDDPAVKAQLAVLAQDSNRTRPFESAAAVDKLLGREPAATPGATPRPGATPVATPPQPATDPNEAANRARRAVGLPDLPPGQQAPVTAPATPPAGTPTTPAPVRTPSATQAPAAPAATDQKEAVNRSRRAVGLPPLP